MRQTHFAECAQPVAWVAQSSPAASLAWVLRCPGDMTNDRRHLLGKLGENLACAELQRRGYALIERRYRTRVGEIDIVARDGDAIVIVEVKTREGDVYGGGAAAVTSWKQRRIGQMAVDYLARHRLLDHPVRFDVVVVDFRTGQPCVEVYPHAFTM
jgi:putative endonuclease